MNETRNKKNIITLLNYCIIHIHNFRIFFHGKTSYLFTDTYVSCFQNLETQNI